MNLRVFFAVVILICCAALIAHLFWQQELKYALPTPIPVSYTPVLFEETVRLPDSVSSAVFLHFFNPDCPCSRFNRKYVNQLIFQYKDQIKFKVVIPPYASLEEARTFFDDDIEIIVDNGGWARACGVYSTPQAVIVDQQSNLFFRGNYNRTRYCTDPQTNYAEQALTAFIKGQPLPVTALDELARRAYGCSFGEEL